MAETLPLHELKTWLDDKPPEWSAAIALRTALRVAPIIFNGSQLIQVGRQDGLTATTARALAISWAARKIPEKLMVPAVRSAAYAAYVAANSSAVAAVNSVAAGVHPAAYPFAARSVASAAYTVAVRSAAIAVRSSDAANAAADAAAAAFGADADAAAAVSDDVQWFMEREGAQEGANLLSLPLWYGTAPVGFANVWALAKNALLNAEANWNWWIDWYQRRIDGEAVGFALRQDDDAEMQRRLILADDAWWNRDTALVNADITAWLKELARPPTIIDPSRRIDPAPEPLATLEPDPQTTDAPFFVADEQGRLAIDGHSRADELLTDAVSVQRHAAARKRALRSAEQLRGHNQAGYFADYARDLADALADNLADGDFAETVLIANSIRVSAQAHETAGPTDDIQPLSTDIKRVVDDLINAVNLHVGQQPMLAAMDVAQMGPDVRVTVTPADLLAVLGDESAEAAIAPRTRDYLFDVSKQAPDEPSPDNRLSRRLAATAANFARGAINIISHNREMPAAFGVGALGWGTVVALGPIAGTAAVVVSAFALACNMKKHPAIWMKYAGPSPATQANMRRVLEWLDSWLPADSGTPPKGN